MLIMDSSCVPAGFSYLLGFGLGIAAIVLSSWLILLMRAVYREDGAFGVASRTLRPFGCQGSPAL